MALKEGYLLQIAGKNWGRVIGGSSFPGHQGWIDVTSFSLGSFTGVDRDKGLEIFFTVPVGKYSSGLMHMVLVGDFVKGKLDSVYPYGPASTLLEFENGILTQQGFGGQTGGAEPQAQLKLSVGKEDAKLSFGGRRLYGPPTWAVR
jgi:hypothetical protein